MSYKNQENHNLNMIRLSTDTNTDINQMLELSDKHFKAADIKMLQQWITHCLEMKTQKSKNYKKKLETIELKNTITEIKKKTQITLTKWSQYGDAKDSISKCEYRAIELSQFKWQKLNKV